jgi:hypothetical protein
MESHCRLFCHVERATICAKTMAQIGEDPKAIKLMPSKLITACLLIVPHLQYFSEIIVNAVFPISASHTHSMYEYVCFRRSLVHS